MSAARTAHVLDDHQLRALGRCSSAQHAAVLLAIDHLPAVPAVPRAALLEEARGWLTDCGWEVGVDVVDDAPVAELVCRQDDGGWAAFVVADVDVLGPWGAR